MEDDKKRKTKAKLVTAAKGSNNVFVLDYNGLPSRPIPTSDNGDKVGHWREISFCIQSDCNFRSYYDNENRFYFQIHNIIYYIFFHILSDPGNTEKVVDVYNL